MHARRGSTILESVLSTNPKIRDLGETNALYKAVIHAMDEANQCSGKNILMEKYVEECREKLKDYSHSIDKNLYNISFTESILRGMPAAKIIHCQRNPLDNILSMLWSNLQVGNNYTSN